MVRLVLIPIKFQGSYCRAHPTKTRRSNLSQLQAARPKVSLPHEFHLFGDLDSTTAVEMLETQHAKDLDRQIVRSPSCPTTGGIGGGLPQGPGPAPETGTDGNAPMPRPPNHLMTSYDI